MREYPHGLEAEILPDDLAIEQATVDDYEGEVENARVEENALLFSGLGTAYHYVACYSYALGESPPKVKELLRKALEHHVTAFKIGIALDPFEFIQLISLAIVLDDREASELFAKQPRSRYTNEDVKADEVVYTVAELISAFVLKDKNTSERILGANNPDTMDAKKIFRYDRMIFFPLLSLLSAIQKKDSNKFTVSMNVRETEFVKFFSRTDEKNDPEALIDLPGLAVLILAKEQGLAVEDKSVYRPKGLNQGA